MGKTTTGHKRPLLVQTSYFLVTGIWPIVHIRSFMAVTGPKTDTWLVKLFGALVGVLGAVMGWAIVRKRSDGQTVLLARSTSAALAAFDLYYFARGRLTFPYLVDAALQIAFIVAMRGKAGDAREAEH